MTKVDGCFSSFNYTPSTAVLVHFDGNFFIRKCANSAISSCKQVVHLSTKDWCWMNPVNCLFSLPVVFHFLSPFLICLTSTEPSVAPPRVWARTLSASEIEVFWDPVHQSGSKGRITGYEVHKHHKWREGKKEALTSHCITSIRFLNVCTALMAGCAISCSPTRVCDPPATFFTISSAEWRGLLTAGPVSRGAPIPRLSGHLYKSPFRCVDIIHQFPLLQTLQLLGRFSPREKPTGFCPFLSFQPERASVRNPRSRGCSVVKPQSRSQLRVVKKHIWKSTNTSRFPCCDVQVFIERSKKRNRVTVTLSQS